MTKVTNISLYENYGPFCVSTSDGKKVFDVIKTNLIRNNIVELSFKDVSIITSAFLNIAIGQIYGIFKDKEEIIANNFKYVDLSDEDRILLDRVISNAIEYYKDPERIRKIEENFEWEDNE